MNNKIILLILIGISYNYTHSQCEVKTTHRPDGVTIKYFKPKIIISPYNSNNTSDYYFTRFEVSKLFQKDYSGYYTSDKATFKSEINSNKNFTETSPFNIAVEIQEDNTDGRIIIQDTRIPEKLLIYRVLSLKDKIELEGYNIIRFDCINEVTNLKEQAIFYSDDKGLRLMISNDDSTQVFHNLIQLKQQR
jgi:hypothetical protein